ncbi:SxtJ family membrane protein [Flagellimonas meridianipacifica]|uniref:SxtJ n=1 Tax=Flagellimonas meridianipacifica TaxID=1080225 RepID=A0A2T0M8L7_9FLAO|nr:SxtJ family membrane protein [Allomuricauda pacifica]PRX53819.1 hypothetical protein CLV81_2207 [Allomuricauda pacifica]
MEVGVLGALLCLIVYLFYSENVIWIWISISSLGLVLLLPKFFQPLAFLWFGLGKVLGLVSTRVLLTITFFLLVIPVGYIRKLLGKDELRLKRFKKSRESVFFVREHVFGPDDLKNTF